MIIKAMDNGWKWKKARKSKQWKYCRVLINPEGCNCMGIQFVCVGKYAVWHIPSQRHEVPVYCDTLSGAKAVAFAIARLEK